jgi:hypothetical protein
MFGGAITTSDACAPDPAVTSSAMTPLVRALSPRVPEAQVMASALAVWAQVHGAVSLELAGVAPGVDDWDAAYAVVLDTVERAFPAA